MVGILLKRRHIRVVVDERPEGELWIDRDGRLYLVERSTELAR